MKYKNVIRR